MTFYFLNATKRSAAAVLMLTATAASAPSVAYPTRDFDPVPSAFDRGADIEHSDAKAWYDRDFDFDVEAEVDKPGTSKARDFDAVESS